MKSKNTIPTILLLGLIFFYSGLQAQNLRYRLQEHDHKPYHFGFYVAVNEMNFSILTDRTKLGTIHDISSLTSLNGIGNAKFYGVTNVPSVGFSLGLIGNKKITQYLDLRFTPGLAFGDRSLDYTFRDERFAIDSIVTERITISSTHIDLPIYLKYKSKRYKNFRAYVLGGAKLSIDLASNSDKNNPDGKGPVLLKRNDLMVEAGVGFDYYMSFFKFGIEIKMSYGINDIKSTSGNIYADGIRSLRSKNFMISLTFE